MNRQVIERKLAELEKMNSESQDFYFEGWIFALKWVLEYEHD